MHFAICADYPPFEYVSHGEFVGFEIDLARQVATAIGRVAIFHDMAFASIFPALKNGFADAAISAITSTHNRRAAYDMTQSYFQEILFTVFDIFNRIEGREALAGQKVACQLGSTMELWLRKNVPSAKISTVDTSNQAIEMLKAGHVGAVVIDAPQAREFVAQNANLFCAYLDESSDGYAIAFPKGSALAKQANQVIEKFKTDGTIDALKEKWRVDANN
ncbi:MAG: transporter substrate-binding domain-containing protein [Puniceicoccales bacterium]|nr:transporter substrate-binding domain-containing protein [Puniceicoccales bacterium]